ncbi:MAG: alpha/beta hydrolase [Erysipelotrichaceae bacterium]|nr:alpha/beta hydrolase [Erysipelotrichaceae bacterium]
MIALYIVLGLLGALLLFYILPTLIISNVIYTVLFVRTSKDKWSRTVSWDDEEQKEMFRQGEEWGNKYEKNRKRVEINSQKFHLIGEYFDFGSDKVVIVIPGRMESGTYSYYFSEPYRKAGYNVLAIDNRSHGLSEGRYNTIGLKEYKDILAWIKFAHDELGNSSVIIHGLCIGSATGLYAITDKSCPSYVKALIADGMYVNFHESLKQHLIERKKPIFPFVSEIMGMMRIVAGKSAKKWGPINVIKKMNKPMLFIYSKEDFYSLPELGEKLYETCPVKEKRIEFFPHGQHSHVRINNTEGYDSKISSFLVDFVK